jgi:hypothetical protein
MNKHGATADSPRSRVRDKVEAVKIHHLVPRSHKVTQKRLLQMVMIEPPSR